MDIKPCPVIFATGKEGPPLCVNAARGGKSNRPANRDALCYQSPLPGRGVIGRPHAGTCCTAGGDASVPAAAAGVLKARRSEPVRSVCFPGDSAADPALGSPLIARPPMYERR